MRKSQEKCVFEKNDEIHVWSLEDFTVPNMELIMFVKISLFS
jgi:hypothetical protein